MVIAMRKSILLHFINRDIRAHWGQTPVRENKDSESNIKSFLKMHKIQCECWID